jgi:hypothetical protein
MSANKDQIIHGGDAVEGATSSRMELSDLPSLPGLPLVGSAVAMRRDVAATLERAAPLGDVVRIPIGPRRLGTTLVGFFSPSGVQEVLTCRDGRLGKSGPVWTEAARWLGCGLLTSKVHYNDQKTAELPLKGSGWYWKVGAYVQTNTSNGDRADAVGAVTVYALQVNHNTGAGADPNTSNKDTDKDTSATGDTTGEEEPAPHDGADPPVDRTTAVPIVGRRAAPKPGATPAASSRRAHPPPRSTTTDAQPGGRRDPDKARGSLGTPATARARP